MASGIEQVELATVEKGSFDQTEFSTVHNRPAGLGTGPLGLGTGLNLTPMYLIKDL